MKRGMEPFLVLNRTISSKSVITLNTSSGYSVYIENEYPQLNTGEKAWLCSSKDTVSSLFSSNRSLWNSYCHYPPVFVISVSFSVFLMLDNAVIFSNGTQSSVILIVTLCVRLTDSISESQEIRRTLKMSCPISGDSA